MKQTPVTVKIKQMTNEMVTKNEQIRKSTRPNSEKPTSYQPRVIVTTSMTITIIIDGVERTYIGDYYEMHNIEWNDKVRDQIDNITTINENIPD